MKVVLATDGSAHARIAEETLAKMAGLKGADWRVVSVATPLPVVVDTPQGEAVAGGSDELTRAWHLIKDATKKTADEVADRMRSRGFKAEGVLLEGDPARTILDYCQNEGADLVAIGSRGMGGFMSFLLGSVARRIVSYASCSVLVAHTTQGIAPDAFAERIAAKDKLDVLAAADGSNGAAVAMEKLCSLGSYGTGVAVCVEPLSIIPPGLNPAEFGAAYRYDEERSEQVAQNGAEKLAKCCKSVFHLVELGRPGHVLIEQAKQHNSDLIVLGATKHGFFERFLLGSVSQEVATEAPCPVLVVRVPA